MKRLISLLLLLTIGLTLCACDGFTVTFNPIQTTSDETALDGTTPKESTPEETSSEGTTTPEATTPEGTTPEVTTPEGTTPEGSTTPDTPVTPDKPELSANIESVGYQVFGITDKAVFLRAIIDSDDNVYIDFKNFFNQIVSPVEFANMPYEETLEFCKWYVDGKLAQADTKLFGGSVIICKPIIVEDTVLPTPPETSITPDYIGIQLASATNDSHSLRVIIDANDDTYIDLASFVELIFFPSIGGDGDDTYEDSLTEYDWFVDGAPANADTKVFGGSIVTLTEKEKQEEQPPSIEDGDEVTIVFYHTMGANLREVLDIYIEEFNELYPNITVEHKQVGGYDDVFAQIKTALTVGDQPNIAYCYPEHVAVYNKVGAVKTLDDFVASLETITRADGTVEQIGLTQAQIDDFIDGFYEEGSVYGDDLMYTMPLSKSTEVLYYNKTFFEKHNIKVPTTWDEMEEVCAQLKAIDPNCIPLGYDSESNWFINMCQQLGSPYTSATGDHFLFDNETNRNFVARFREWYQKGYVTTQELLGAYTSTIFTETDPHPYSVRCYMSIGSSAGAQHQRPDKGDDGKYPFEVGIAPIPQVDPSNPKVIARGPSLCIFEDANEAEVLASWLFMKFLTTNVGFQAEFSMASGYIPVIKSVEDHPVYANFLNKADGGNNIAALSAKVCLGQADAYFTSPAFVGSSEARDQVGILLQYCMCDNSAATAEGIKKAFERAIEECNYQIGN